MKVKDLFKSKRKVDGLPTSINLASTSGPAGETSSVQSVSNQKESSNSKPVLIDGIQEVSVSSDSNGNDTSTYETPGPDKETILEDTISGLAITENGDSNARVKSAKEQLLDASAALTDTLKLYRKGHKDDEASIPFLDDDAQLGEPGEHMTPEKVATTVDAVIAQQQNQKPTAASRVGNVIGKIYPLVSLTMGVGATVAESASFVPVKGAVNGLCLLLSIANQEQGRSADFLRQLDRISYQALRVAEIQRHGEIDIGDLILESSTKLMTAILLFFKEAVIFFRHDYFFNLGKTILLGPQIYADAKATLDTAINDYDQALLLQVTIKVLMMKAVPPPAEDHGASKKSELLSWLKSSHWDVDAEYSRHCEDRAPGTLEWVLEAREFIDWRLSDKRSRDSRSLWLNGLPGVGKSTIAAYITQVLQAQYPDAAVLYFFCKSGDSSLDNVIKIIRTLSAQLLLAVPAARTHLQALKDDNFTGSDSVAHMLQKLIRDSLVGVLQDVFVIIDGFDECENSTDGRGGDSGMERLLQGLLNTDVKLLVSSRPTPEISRAMSPAKKRDFTYEDSRGDIQSYVSMCVSKSKILEKGFKTMEKDPAKFIADKSQGNFLWVKIVLNILKNKSSTKDFQEVIATIPKDLEDVYDQILTKLDASGSLELALTIIRCVLFSIRPLTIQEVEVVANILQGDIIDLRDFIESHCGSFLRIAPGKASGLYIVHETFRSYITAAASSKEKCVLPSGSKFQLATACVGCLVELRNEEFDPFRSYATEYWLDHLANFLDEPIPASEVKVQHLVERMHELLGSSDALREWMKQFAFLCSEPYRIGNRIANMHDIVMDFLEAHAESSLEYSSRNLVSDEFLWVWINTDWQEVDKARYMLEAAHVARFILSPPPGVLESGGKRRERILEQKDYEGNVLQKRGWKFQYSGDLEFHHKVTLSELEDLAKAANYNENIGVHCGNYAFGELAAGSDHCVQSFQDAIDEHPECWHLLEGLGSYYEQNDKKEDAIKCYAKAMKVDMKNPASAAFDYWKLVAEGKEEEGDEEGAIEAWKTGVANVPDKEAHRYWDAAVKIREKSGNGNAMADLYKEAIEKHPGACHDLTKKLAEVYGRGGARQLQFQTYHSAMKVDPENTDEYGEKIRTLAREMKDVCIWQPVDFILGVGIESDPDNAAKYHKELGLSHMCRRSWEKAIDHLGIYARLEQDDWVYVDIGNAFLGLGNVPAAMASYQQGIKSKTSYMALARTVGFAHVVEGNYSQAIKFFKSALSDAIASPGKGMSHGFMQKVDDVNALRMFELHRALGLCYEAMGRPEDMRKCLEAGVACYREIALEMDEEKDRDTLYRHEARGLFELGLVLEKLGQREEALIFITRAVVLFEKTTLDTDDEVQSSEAAEAAAALERLSSSEDQKTPPDLKEKFGEMRLQRRLALKYTTDWYCFKHWGPPRRRGGMAWNEVSFVNKFKITNGDRTFIAPWGFGHGE